MKTRSFVILMVMLALLLVMTGYAVWETMFAAPGTPQNIEIKTETDQEEREADVALPDGISWKAPGIEVGTLHYTVTRANVLHNISNAGPGAVREGAAMRIYDSFGQEILYYYPDCADESGNLVSGGNLVVLDITVTSQDAVNFITDPVTKVQSRRYADNPFLFRADEIAYLIDITEESENGYTYYDAVFFSRIGEYEEHEMAYEVLPGENISFRIGYLVGNRPDGTDMDFSDVVLTTNWADAEKEFYDLGLS